LLELDDYSIPASFLSEIRAYGYLIQCGVDVAAIPETDTSTPDFEVTHKDEKVYIEVCAKHYDDDESASLEAFNSQTPVPGKGGVEVREHVSTPFGKPAPTENVAENAISRLAAVKQSESQFSDTEPSILWIDFQDELWNPVLKPDSAFSLRTWRHGLWAGEIWYAFFGFPDAPIFAGETQQLQAPRKLVRMRHNGRFRHERTRVDAAVLSFQDATISIENPYTSKPVPDWFWVNFLSVPTYSIEHSCVNWPDRQLADVVAAQSQKIVQLGKLQWYGW
jgi:hypothetical protein